MIKKILTTFLLINFFCVSSNCAMAKKVKPLSQLERREVETRFYDTSDSAKVMKAAIKSSMVREIKQMFTVGSMLEICPDQAERESAYLRMIR